jgi:hypothetical protein
MEAKTKPRLKELLNEAKGLATSVAGMIS